MQFHYCVWYELVCISLYTYLLLVTLWFVCKHLQCSVNVVGQFTKIFWAYSAKEFGGYFHNLMAHIGNSEIDTSFVVETIHKWFNTSWCRRGAKWPTDQEINWYFSHFSRGHPMVTNILILSHIIWYLYRFFRNLAKTKNIVWKIWKISIFHKNLINFPHFFFDSKKENGLGHMREIYIF